MRTLDDLAWFWLLVDKNGADGCWLWTGTVEVQGYGVAWVEGRTRKAHLIVWESIHGAKPEGRYIDHLCRVRSCVNPAHLELVTHRINVLRGVGPTAVNAMKDECVNGHPYDERNTYLRVNGNRDCYECRRLRRARYNARQRAARKAAA